MIRVVILGIGNRLMKDDGIGVYVVEALQNSQRDEHIHYIVGETDIDYCLHVIDGADLLIIVDAVSTNKRPGDISVFPLETYTNIELGISAHNLHLFQMIPVVYPKIGAKVIGIEVDHIDFGMELSGELQKKFYHIVEAVRKRVMDHII